MSTPEEAELIVRDILTAYLNPTRVGVGPGVPDHTEIAELARLIVIGLGAHGLLLGPRSEAPPPAAGWHGRTTQRGSEAGCYG